MLSSSEESPLLQSSNNSTRNRDDGGGSNQEQNETELRRATFSQKSTLISTPTTTLSDSRNTGSSNTTNMTVVALAFTVFVQSYLLEGVFPYAGFLTMHLLSAKNEDVDTAGIDVNEETVGKYAGYVACSFMAGRTITAVLWGRLADSYGRVFVLEASLVCSAITSLGFGFASTYKEALVWRFLMGVGNGITGTIKCLLSEIKESSGSEAKEIKTMAIVYGMRGYGFLLCPAITGYLSDPMQQYPQTMASAMVPLCIQSLLLAYPFVLPNLVAFFLCWSACRLVRDHVEETLPVEKRQPFVLVPTSVTGLCRRLLRLERTADDSSNEISHKFVLPIGNNDKIETNENDKGGQEIVSASATSDTTRDLLWSSGSNKIHDLDTQHQQQRRIRGRWLHLYVYWMFSFLNIASDELFPLFCLSKLSGLGLQENQISFVFGGTTIVYGMLQYLLLTGLVQKIGLYPTLRIGTFGSISPAILIPIGSLWLTTMNNDKVGNDGSVDIDYEDHDGSENSNKLIPSVALYLCILIAVIKSFTSVVFSTLTIATNRTVDTIDQRATLNGIASLGGSFAKACGPVFAGTLFSFLAGNTSKDGRGGTTAAEYFAGDPVFRSYVIDPPYGSIVAYGILSILGFLLGVQALVLRGNTSS
jgi:MFS family permease